MTRRILLVGATGAFGSRLAARLATCPGIELVLAARSAAPLDDLRRRLAPTAVAELSTRIVDRAKPDDAMVAGAWMVVDAAGPFQASDYGLAHAAIGQGAHYLDLADARAFVAGFPAALHEAAASRGVLAVTGASSTPALSHAALQPLVAGWRTLESVVVVIAPGSRAPRGLSVMRAILSYAGRPVRVFLGGGWRTVPGWSGLRRLDMPGLGWRLASICETPDLDLLPARFPIRRDAVFMAGLELRVMHLGLAALCLLVRCKVLSSLEPLSKSLKIAADLLCPFGTDSGGMIVEAEGRDADDRPIRARWSLWAEANSGPDVPVAPAAALIRALLNGSCDGVGAQACVGLIDRDAILDELSDRPIATRIDTSFTSDPLLFRRLAGAAFETLPAPVRAVHSCGTFQGRVTARSGRGIVPLALRRLVGWAPAGTYDAVVEIVPDAASERWTRRFGAHVFASTLAATGRLGVFDERFGPIAFSFDLRPTAVGVTWHLIGWRLIGLPLPVSLAPKIKARGEEAGGLYRFTVVVAHPWIGLLFAYRGWLRTPSTGTVEPSHFDTTDGSELTAY